MKILVTGCCGFIGSHLVDELVSKGHTVDGVDNMANGDLTNLMQHKIRVIPRGLIRRFYNQFNENRTEKSIIIFQTDFSNNEILSLISDGTYDVVYHLAADVSVVDCINRPSQTTKNNLLDTVSLATACVGKTKGLIYASSAAVYGDAANDVPACESLTPNPKSYYGSQKYSCEIFLRNFYEIHHLKSASIRFFNVYGPRQTCSENSKPLIANWFYSSINGKPIDIFGDGSQTRDFVYVSDVTGALVQFLDNFEQMTGSVYNLAYGESISVSSVLENYKQSFPNLVVKNHDFRQGDILKSSANVSKIKKDVNFLPKVSFNEGFQKTLSWWKGQG